jgi:lipoyl(octanoyl) transferase
MLTSWTPTSSPNWRKAEPIASAGVWHWLGRVPFDATAVLQEQWRSEILAERARETLLLLEHDPVITLGRSAAAGNVLYSESALASRGITVHRASRGGDVTYHGPGQLVGYPIVRLRNGVRAHVEGMAVALTAVLAELGVVAKYRRDAPGLWVHTPGFDAKICAFGVNVRHRITVHGFALNLDPDLDAFDLIVPCGLTGCRVTSVRAVLGTSPTPAELAARVAHALGDRLDVEFAASNAVATIAMPDGTTRINPA